MAALLDCEIYCDDCAPDGAEDIGDGGESDYPQNCAHCHEPLGNPLTTDGVQYVLEAIADSLRDGRQARNTVHDCYKGTWYEGSRHCEIVRDWSRELQAYCLAAAESALVDHYLSWTDK